MNLNWVLYVASVDRQHNVIALGKCNAYSRIEQSGLNDSLSFFTDNLKSIIDVHAKRVLMQIFGSRSRREESKSRVIHKSLSRRERNHNLRSYKCYGIGSDAVRQPYRAVPTEAPNMSKRGI